MFDRRGGVLQAVAGEHAHHGGSRRHFVASLQQARHGGGTGGLAEHPLTTTQQLVGVDDLGVGHGHEVTVAFDLRLEGFFSVHRIADPDGRGDGVRLLHRVTQHQWRGPGGLEAHHSRQGAAMAGLPVFVEAHPVGADVAGIAHRDAEPVGGVAEGVDHFEGRRFLALKPVGVEGIHQGDRVGVGHLPNDRQGPVEVALHRQHLGAIEQGLGQFSLGHVAIRNQHEGPHAAAAGIGGRGSRGVAGAGADHRLRAGLLGLGDGHGHAPVLEGAGGVEPVVFEEHLHASADPFADHRRGDQGGGAFPQGDHRCGRAYRQPAAIGLDQAGPVLQGGGRGGYLPQPPQSLEQGHGCTREAEIKSTPRFSTRFSTAFSPGLPDLLCSTRRLLRPVPIGRRSAAA